MINRVDHALIRNTQSFINTRGFEVFGDAHDADAFGHRTTFGFDFTRAQITVHSGAIGIGDYCPHRWFFIFQETTHATDCSARADRTYENVDSTLGLVPDFRSRGFEMKVSICGVFKLIRPKKSRIAVGDRLRLVVWIGNLNHLFFLAEI
jgi:hypothetical protein